MYSLITATNILLVALASGLVSSSTHIPSLLVPLTKPTLRESLDKSVLRYLSPGLKNGIASGLAAAVVKGILQPFDTIKTVQQTEKMFYGPLATTISIVKKRGVMGLWSGLGITMFGSSPSVAVYFGIYSTAKSHLTRVLPPNLSLLAVAISAALGNTIACVVRVPYEGRNVDFPP